MNLAAKKKKSNIIEYILYIWKMEQLARALHFDIDALASFLKGSIKNKKELSEEIAWNETLFQKMKNQNLVEKGNIAEIQEILVELHYLHNTLLNIVKDKEYIAKFEEVKPLIKEFNEKLKANEKSDVLAMIKALNTFLTLKISGKDISRQTQDAISKFSEVLAILAARYKLMKKGELNLNLN